MKIIGFGIDLERLERFDARISKIDDYLIRRFLTTREYKEYEAITNQQGRVRFLTSHWCAKEAIYKALQSRELGLDQIEISRLSNGHLVFRPHNLPIEGLLSLTYSEGHCAAACVLVQKDPDDTNHYTHHVPDPNQGPVDQVVYKIDQVRQKLEDSLGKIINKLGN